MIVLHWVAALALVLITIVGGAGLVVWVVADTQGVSFVATLQNVTVVATAISVVVALVVVVGLVVHRKRLGGQSSRCVAGGAAVVLASLQMLALLTLPALGVLALIGGKEVAADISAREFGPGFSRAPGPLLIGFVIAAACFGFLIWSYAESTRIMTWIAGQLGGSDPIAHRIPFILVVFVIFILLVAVLALWAMSLM